MKTLFIPLALVSLIVKTFKGREWTRGLGHKHILFMNGVHKSFRGREKQKCTKKIHGR